MGSWSVPVSLYPATAQLPPPSFKRALTLLAVERYINLQDSMKKGIYSSPAAVAYDLFLIWSNAREYNQQGSQVYADAEVLEVSVLQVLYRAIGTANE